MTTSNERTPSPDAADSSGLLPRDRRQWLALGSWVALCLGVGAAGGLATAGAVRDWYPTLVKPPLNPPAWVFGPTWTLLYVLMAWAAFLACRRVGLRSRPLALFGIQLIFCGHDCLLG